MQEQGNGKKGTSFYPTRRTDYVTGSLIGKSHVDDPVFIHGNRKYLPKRLKMDSSKLLRYSSNFRPSSQIFHCY